MTEPTIKVQVNGKTAELSLVDAREMLRQLKRVFGEIDSPPVSIPWTQPVAPYTPFIPCDLPTPTISWTPTITSSKLVWKNPYPTWAVTQ